MAIKSARLTSNANMMRKNYRRMLSLFMAICLTVCAFAQNMTVTGVVTSKSDNMPLPGVNVVETGTTNGTITNIDGKYTLVVKQGSTINFSFIGYAEQTHAAAPTINVELVDETELLGDVVVVGYGTQRKEAVTGSVASMNGESIREVPGGNITQNLQGRIAGVEMAQTSSKPGAEMQVRIRGTRSLNASNDPLVVLDGIPFAGSLGDINPSSIKSIDILKDASATAIYGSRGANGVIIVTTNKGTKGQNAKLTYSGYVGAKTVFAKFPMMNGKQFEKLRDYAGKYPVDGGDEKRGTDTDWQDEMYETGLVMNHDLSVTGGGEKNAYSFGAAYYKEEAVIALQEYSRISMRGSLDQNVGDYFKVGFTTTNNYTTKYGDDLGLYNVLSPSPILDIKNSDGTIKRVVKSAQDDSWTYTRETLEALGDNYIDKKVAFGTYNSIYGELAIPGVEGLKYRVNLGLNARFTNDGHYTGEGVFSTNALEPSSASQSNSTTTNWAVENLLTYDRLFADKHQVNFVAMYSAEKSHYHSSHMSARDIPYEAFQFYNIGRANGTITVNPDYQGYNETGLSSWMARLMYSYDSKYMLSVALRSDGSSRLAEGKKWHTYPAVSAGWNIANEEFWGIEKINALKLRVGYGETSNQAVDPYKTLGRLATRPYNFGSSYETGFYVSELPNPDLGWEYSTTMNYGLDFGLFNDRLTGSFEYYVQKTKDVLLSVGLPSTSGVGSFMANIGETENKGWELNLNGTIFQNDDWTIDAGFNIYSNKNKLVKLVSDQKKDEGNGWFVGYAINAIYDYEYDGLWNSSDPDFKYLDILEPGGNEGMIKVKYNVERDSSGKPTRAIGPDDRQIIEVDPKAQGGFNVRAAWKGLDLSVIGAFKCGGKLISTLHTAGGYLNMLSGRRGNVDVDYWTEDNKGAKYPKPGGIQSGDNPKYGSTLGMFDGSYCKVRTITLGYNFDSAAWFKNDVLKTCRAYFTIQNPFVISSDFYKETGLDPETNSYGNENQAVASYNRRILVVGTNTPQTRSFIFGLNMTF